MDVEIRCIGTFKNKTIELLLVAAGGGGASSNASSQSSEFDAQGLLYPRKELAKHKHDFFP